MQLTGIARLDALLNGGLPFGSVCEATGVDGSGRSSIALSVLASASREGACAYVDVENAVSPEARLLPACSYGIFYGSGLLKSARARHRSRRQLHQCRK